MTALVQAQDERRVGGARGMGAGLNAPRRTIILTLIIIAAFAAGLPRLVKDPSLDAFINPDNPVWEARERAMAVFGLEDPMVIALTSDDRSTMFTAERLSALVALTEQLGSIEGVRRQDLISLATESAVQGDGGDLTVDPIIPNGALDTAAAVRAWELAQSMPPYLGVLVSESGNALMIVTPVDDPAHAVETYRAVKAAADAVALNGVSAHVAGVSAANARAGDMISSDTAVFVPAAVLVLMLVVLIAVGRWIGLLGALLVIAGSTAVAVGLMGWLGYRYYLVTTALPVIIMAIAVADCLHITLFFQRVRANAPQLTAREAMTRALRETWLPVSLTSVTTVAGFVGLALGSSMTPIKEFSWFAAVGVAAAWALSLSALPAVIVATNLRATKRSSEGAGGRVFGIDALVAALSGWAVSRPRIALSLSGLVTLAFLGLGSLVQYEFERKEYFQPDEPVRIAMDVVNERFAGFNMLDVIVAAEDPGELMTAGAIAAMADLEARLAKLPHTNKVVGVSDYIALMHERLTGSPAGALPTRQRAPAQYMFLYEASGDPGDFKEEIDYDYRQALIRAHLGEDSYQQTTPSVEAAMAIARDWSAETGLTAEVSGRVAVNHAWMSKLSTTHAQGLGLAFAFVCLATIALFRSLRAAAIAVIPVLTGVTFVYALMGVLGLNLSPATSMCAAISTGLGVDFGVHLVDRMRQRLASGASPIEAVQGGYVIVARACAFSSAALGLGLSVVVLSSAPALQWYGLLIAAGSFGALLGALVIVPAAGRFLLTPPRAQEPSS